LFGAISLSTPFILRPVATILLTFGVAAAGALAFFQLPVSPLPQVDFPTISVRAQLPGGSPDVVATTPLERHLGQIADVTEMTSSSTVGAPRINLRPPDLILDTKCAISSAGLPISGWAGTPRSFLCRG
jgi:multidrug efflux pump